MKIIDRTYRNNEEDFLRIRNLLAESYQIKKTLFNWGVTRWDTVRYRVRAKDFASNNSHFIEKHHLWETDKGELVGAMLTENNDDDLVSDSGGDLITRHIAPRSAAFRPVQSVGFHPVPGIYPIDHYYTFFGAQYRACSLVPLSFGPPLPVLPVSFSDELLAKLCSCGTPADQLLRARASSAKRLTARSILLNARASPAERYTAFAMCGHPLGNNIKFHPPFRWNPSDSDLAGHEHRLVR